MRISYMTSLHVALGWVENEVKVNIRPDSSSTDSLDNTALMIFRDTSWVASSLGGRERKVQELKKN